MVSRRDRISSVPVAGGRGWHLNELADRGSATKSVNDGCGRYHGGKECTHFGCASTPKSLAAPTLGVFYARAMANKPRAVDIKADVARRLKAARSIVFDSGNKCADVLEVPHNTWNHYEKGDRYPDPYHLVRFCDKTGFTTDFIYRGHFRGIAEDVQIRLAAEFPELVDEAQDVAHSAKVRAPA
jgi:hypothetical protein